MSFDEAMELLDRIEQTTETIYVASVFNSRTQVRLREIQNDVDRLRKLTLAARPAEAEKLRLALRTVATICECEGRFVALAALGEEPK